MKERVDMDMVNEKELIETVSKSDLCAKTKKEYEKLTDTNAFFIDCKIEEEKENLNINYNIEDKKCFTEIRKDKRINQIRALLELFKIRDIFYEYNFKLVPENLYYDRNYRVFIKTRDIYETGSEGNTEELINQLKALIGYTLQKKYSFDDYYIGGNDLYKKDAFLKKINETSDIQELYECLETEFNSIEEITYSKKIEVSKSGYYLYKRCLTGATIVILMLAVYCGYLLFTIVPRKNAIVRAMDCYLTGEYINVIDSLKDVDMKYLDKYQKYILAVSYVKSESLTSEQKENILNKLAIDGEESIKEYWIYLGRLDTLEAENIAMQQSDDELLLYAYMTEKAILEKNTRISGESKMEQLKLLEQKISDISLQYEQTDDTQETDDSDILLGE